MELQASQRDASAPSLSELRERLPW
jgi:hypothetical protein